MINSGTINVKNLLSSASIFLVSLIYYSSNSEELGLKLLPLNFQSFLNIGIFIIFEFMILLLLLLYLHKKDILWYTIGATLLFIPWVQIGSGSDFCMRASIPELTVLMIWAGQALLTGKNFRYRIPLVCVLVLGAVTPLYEINRSIYRTAAFWVDYQPGQSTQYNPPAQASVEELPKFNMAPETDHPESLWAMDYPSLGIFDLDKYFQVAVNIDDSLFARILMRK